MLFSPMWVTEASNMKRGKPIDANIVGQVMTHDVIMTQVPQFDKDKKPIVNEQGQQAFAMIPATRLGVAWENAPVPCLHYYDPQALYYLRDEEIEEFNMPDSFYEEESEEGEEVEFEGEGPSA